MFIRYCPRPTVFLIIDCFSSSSINTKKKFWGAPHILHMGVIFLFKLGFTPWKAEQPLQGMELQEQETQK